jgi:hypothetical protein
MTRRDDLYARARILLKRSEADRWELAECMTQLYELGESQRAIAEQLGCAYATVNTYLRLFNDHAGSKKRPSFGEALGQVRDYAAERIPKTPEARAALVANLLKDKAVADAPVVRKVEERHADRRLRAEVNAFHRENSIPTRTQDQRDDRRVSSVSNSSFWFKMLSDMKVATRSLNEATSELDRTGLPRSGSGEVIKANRALLRAAERFEEAASRAGIGTAM